MYIQYDTTVPLNADPWPINLYKKQARRSGVRVPRSSARLGMLDNLAEQAQLNRLRALHRVAMQGMQKASLFAL